MKKEIVGFLVVMLSVSLQARETVVFFCAHPDDLISSLGTCLRIKDRYDIHVVDFTYGERGLGETGFKDGSTKAKRMLEEASVCRELGATLHWLGAEDGNTYVTSENCAKLAGLLKKIGPCAVFGHWPLDCHMDHVMSAAVLQKAMKLAQFAGPCYFFEEAHQSRSFVDTYYVDITSVIEEKRRLIRLYASQNGNDYMAEYEIDNSRMRGARLHDPAGKRIQDCHGRKYAEAFGQLNGVDVNGAFFATIGAKRN